MYVLSLTLQLFSVITQCVFTEQKPTCILPLEKPFLTTCHLQGLQPMQ